MNKIAIVDLAAQDVRVGDVPAALRQKFLGGRGINTYLLYNYTDANTRPLSPENVLIFGAGLLTGALGVGTSRLSISAKSPETGILGDGNMGGFFGAELRFAGFDHLVILNKAERPTYLWIHEGRIEFRDAGHLEELSVGDTQQAIKDDLGDQRVQVACIGPAGRKMVVFANVMNGLGDAVGRTGMGAVMGSKNLWAVAARGSGTIPVRDIEGLKEVTAKHYRLVTETKGYHATAMYGTLIRLNNTRTEATEGAYNHQFNMMEGGGEELDADVFLDQYEVGKEACFNCPVHCKHRFAIKDGPHKGVTGVGPEYYGGGGWGSQCGSGNWDTILEAWELVDRYGLDVGSASAYTAWVMELWEKGIITEKDTGGLKFEWGNHEAITGVLHQVVTGEGIGALLARGWREAAKIIGHNSGQYMSHFKGLTIEPDERRHHKAWSLGLATATRGACHLRSMYHAEAFQLPPEVSAKITGRPIAPDPATYETKEWAVFWTECLCALADSLGICKFVSKWLSAGLLGPAEFAESIEALTGVHFSVEDLMQTGERIWNVEKLYLLREGLTRQDDSNIPAKWLKPLTHGNMAGHRMDPVQFEALLDRYYELHGWDREGVPTPQTLERLGLRREQEDVLGIGSGLLRDRT
ncbi:MAG: aldehyde ferredoxin oxidoreductase family protein [Chloroflexi bacterium]|nr:aldehyde ferredoxin oxidoreductase family protein [Chloroflexota bacterium]